MSLFNKGIYKGMFGKGIVSILVLMDVSLQRKRRKRRLVLTLRFNPCFNGCLSSTIIVAVDVIFILLVSILVLMDVSLQQKWMDYA